MFNCKKCGSISLYTEVKGNSTGLYCKDCGAWIKWLNKEEIRAFKHKDKEDNVVNSTIEKRIEDFIKFLDEAIDNEYSKGFTENPMETMRRSSYCLALERDKNSLINILQGHDYDYMGDK